MFGLLKSKISGFIDKLVGKEQAKEEKEAEAQKQQIKEQSPEQPPAKTTPQPVQPDFQQHAPQPEKQKPVLEQPLAKTTTQSTPPVAPAQPRSSSAPQTTQQSRAIEAPQPKPAQTPPLAQAPPQERKERELAPRIGLFGKVKSFFTNEVTINESEVEPLLEELKMALLESDVSLDTADFLADDLRRRLVGKKIGRNALKEEVRCEVRSALLDLLESASPKEKILDKIKAKKPFVILFLGPNGAGKTTTIAKFVQMLQTQNLSSVISASDSFRAAAIEQAMHHGSALGVKVVKHAYGADPAAIAFDAIAHAKAQGIDAVLIDTAGRQETNLNLVKEMEKISRVVKPDLRVFVGEAIAGHALVEQVKRFKQAVGVDAIVLTKLDCDAKGGSSFSLAHETKTPILFLGTGQSYSDLKPFNAEWLVDNVLAA